MPSAFNHPLIALEGIDGSGKATQSKLLVEDIQRRNQPVVRFEFPNYTNVTGPYIDTHLKQKWKAQFVHTTPPMDSIYGEGAEDRELNELLFQCLQTVNRYEQALVLIEALKAQAVILDRYYASGLVYGTANGVPEQFLRTIHALLPKPDLYIFVDIPVEESYRRRPERRDRYEKQKGMLERVRDIYLNLFTKEGWKIIDGVGSVDQIHARICDCVPTSFIW